ncbi:hypothetical protein [Fusibacter tunisiensis]|uniref:Cthe-2314-like HEPN domain-containing protein n=1 Tax=Fusibacter tunisiensis TaxID=1008308 RepID=A0ABS2MTV9_9FIRM|nr:hypothetical protein [Fusibacter tunisiensis]MBM7562846.1 hypothetical protein [Fusibacter tunisiensis]
MTFTPTHSEVYYGISIGYYNQFKEAYSEINKMSDGNGNVQMLDLSVDEQSKFYWLESLQRQALMICIVFQAFAIEAFVNMVAVNLYDEDEFFNNFEKMGTEKKINKIFSEKLKSDYKSKHPEIKSLVDLAFNLRDSLAHHKSKKVDLVEMQKDPIGYGYHPYQDLMTHYDKIDDVVKAYEQFKLCVNTLLGYDIFEKQMEDLNKSLQFNINEIFRKGFGIELSDDI